MYPSRFEYVAPGTVEEVVVNALAHAGVRSIELPVTSDKVVRR